MSGTNLLMWIIPAAITILGTVLLYWVIAKSFAHHPNNRLYRQFAQLVLILVANVVLVVVLPLDVETRGQLLGLFGLVITAIIALSSTTFVSNAMAGMTLKLIGSFRTGDFIQVGDHFGRVRIKTLLHTEIQSEDRDTVTLPNIYVITNPVKVVDQSGTLISAEVSIGYDVHRESVRVKLREAAELAGLTDPFVQILSLGSFAVDYRITGFLSDVGKLVTKRTELKGAILDVLHDANIEIMTPTVMNQRAIGNGVIPRSEPDAARPAQGKAEEQMFDKAELATRIERFRGQIANVKKEIEALQKSDDEAAKIEIGWREQQIKALQDFIDHVTEKEE